MSRRLAAIVAVLAPAAIVGGVLGYLGRADTPAGEAEVPEAVASCVRMVERTGRDVIVVGNSKIGTDIDRVALAKGLGVKAVGAVSLPGSSAPYWYAALERCVFDEGHHPRLVVVYATAGSMLRTTLDSERERLAIAPFLGESEPVLDEKVFGGARASPFWQRVGSRKTEAVLALQHGVRDLVAGLFFAPPGDEGVLAAGRAYAEPALEKVLGADAGEDAVTRHRAIPIAEDRAGAGAARDATIAGTLVPDFVALAQARGTRIVFARAPVAPSKVDSYEVVDPTLLRELVVTLNERGAGWLDLTGIGLPGTAYGDGVHMSPAGKVQLTATLAERLLDLDALGAAPFAPAPVPRAPATVRRSGAPPAVPTPGAPTRGPWDCGWQLPLRGFAGLSDSVLGRAGVGSVSPLVLYEDGVPLQAHAKREAFDLACAGAFNHQGNALKFSPSGGPADVVPSRTYTVGLSDELPLRDPAGNEAWWVYPGTTLRAEAAEGWDAPLDGFALRVEALVAIEGARPATFAWEAGEAPIGADGSATLAGGSPAASWWAEVRSPPDGPWLLVRRVVAGTEDAPWHLLGSADTGRAVDLFKGEVAWAAEPPPVGALGSVEPAKDGTWRIDTSALTAPDSEAITRGSGINRCSPVRLFEDGVPLAVPNVGLAKLPTTAGAYAHTSAGVLFTTPDGTSPLTNGRTYTAALDPKRVCLTSRWLYPGDHARFRVGPRQLGGLGAGATTLHLTGVSFGDTDAVLTVRVLVGGRELLATAVPLATLHAAPSDWTLPAPVDRDAEEVVVELSTPPDAPFTQITELALTEPARPAFPDAVAGDATAGKGSAAP